MSLSRFWFWPSERHTHGESDVINEHLQSRRKSNLVTYHRMFELPASNISYVHRVLVLPLMGPNLDQTCSEMPTSTHMSHRMSAAWQFLLSLKEYEAKIVYRGKLKPFSHFISLGKLVQMYLKDLNSGAII